MVSCHACVLSAHPQIPSSDWGILTRQEPRSWSRYFCRHHFPSRTWPSMNSLNSCFKSLKCFASNTSFWTTIPVWPPWHWKCLLTSKLYKYIIWDNSLIYPKDYFCYPDIHSYKSFRGSNLSPDFVVLCWREEKVIHFSSEKMYSWSFRYPLCTYVSVWVYDL